MKILSIETSCDETGIALVEVDVSQTQVKAHTIQSELFSQIDIHKEFGGVFPVVAKREHAKWLPILMEKVLNMQCHPGFIPGPGNTNDEIPGQARDDIHPMRPETWSHIEKILEREIGLFEPTKKLLLTHSKPDINMIAVTEGPGLEPALWVGISFARALALYWDIPLIGTNHMKGHIFSVLLNQKEIHFPALALLISGGHTELVEMNSISVFTIIGKTKDDAIGESYDKVARMIGLEYPGGPKIAELAALARHSNLASGDFVFPRPMLHSPDLDFSFSGLKTSILYKIRELETLDETLKMQIAHEFEQAVTDVIVYKLKKALTQKNYETLIVSGGVIANTYLRSQIETLAASLDILLLLPQISDSTDNAQMIAVAGAIESLTKPQKSLEIKAQGNMSY
jgi:N6-L-threonylcarbamoyladenine synthase